MRLFIAVDLPPPIVDSVSEVRQTVDPGGEQARWVRPEAMHLTLKFLGEVDPERLETIDRSLQAIHVAAFKVSISGVGFFPNERSTRVLWVGVSSRGLHGLAVEVERKMLEIGYSAESRPFSPHLTVARAPGRRRIHRSLARTFAGFADREWGSFTADRFCLYQSRLRRSGALYERLKVYPLETT